MGIEREVEQSLTGGRPHLRSGGAVDHRRRGACTSGRPRYGGRGRGVPVASSTSISDETHGANDAGSDTPNRCLESSPAAFPVSCASALNSAAGSRSAINATARVALQLVPTRRQTAWAPTARAPRPDREACPRSPTDVVAVAGDHEVLGRWLPAQAELVGSTRWQTFSSTRRNELDVSNPRA